MREPNDDDTATVFCFSSEFEMEKACAVIAAHNAGHWMETRKAAKGVMYPYWLACRADRSQGIADILKNSGIRWDHMEAHYYAAVKEQSSKNLSALDWENTIKEQPKHHATQIHLPEMVAILEIERRRCKSRATT